MKTILKTGAAVLACSTALLSTVNASITIDHLWSVAPNDSRPDMGYIAWSNTGVAATDSLYNHRQRGMAYNSVTNQLYLASRGVNGVDEVIVINATTGQRVGNLNISGVAGGNFSLNKIAVSADGQVFLANLTTDAAGTNPYKLYRLDSTVNGGVAPTTLFSGNPFGTTAFPGVHAQERRFGDTLDIRGTGNNIQILTGGRADSTAVIFTTNDGSTFSPNPLVVADGQASGHFYNGISFGEGDTFWGASGVPQLPLRQFQFDIAAGTGAPLQTVGSDIVAARVGPVGYIPDFNLMVGVGVGGEGAPQDLFVYDMNGWVRIAGADGDGAGGVFFPGQNNNGNGTGDVAWNSEDNIFYVLSTNNGIMAFHVIPEPSTYALIFGLGILGFLGVRRRFRRS